MSLSRDEMLRSLSLLATGVPTWHPLGFVSCTLVSGCDWALKVHLWPQGKRLTKSPNWPIHDHSFRIASRILHGSIRNREYSLKRGSRFELYRVDYESKASVLVPTAKLTDIRLRRSIKHSTDDSYAVEIGQFHNSVVSTASTAATLVLKTQGNLQPPFVIGRPFSEDRLIPVYQRTQFPFAEFWSGVFAPLESSDYSVGLRAGEVRLAEHSVDWVIAYAREVLNLRQLLANDFITAEHIGSTSIPGLVAKPIIDMMVAVPNMHVAEQLVERLTAAGYIYRPDGSLPDRVYFNRRVNQVDTHHISLSTKSTRFWAEKIVFRDFLRRNADARREYAKLKQSLAQSLRQDRAAYTNSKHSFVYGILGRAKQTDFGDSELLDRLQSV